MTGFNKTPLKDRKQQQTRKSKKPVPARLFKSRGHYQHLNCMVVEINCLVLFSLASSWLRPIKLWGEKQGQIFPFSNID